MKSIGTACLCVILAVPLPVSAQQAGIAPPGCDYGARHPEAPDEIGQFDFLIGDFAVSVSRKIGEVWEPVPVEMFGPARWNGRWVLGGMAIEDEWYDKDPGLDPLAQRGINVRIWDAEDGEWDMMWFKSGANQVVTDLRAREIEGRLEMWQVAPYRPDFRAYFERVDADRWNRITLAPDADGQWRETVRLEATRIPCD